MSEEAKRSPFEILGLAPTLDLAAVKRAYFAKLQAVPPHVDPEGFAALRAAYEPVSTLPGLVQAYQAAPLDLAADCERCRVELAPAVEAGKQSLLARAGERQLKAAFLAAMARLRLFGGTSVAIAADVLQRSEVED